VGQHALQAPVGHDRPDQVGRRAEQRLQQPAGLRAEGGLGEGGQLAQGRRRPGLGLVQQGHGGGGPACEATVGVGVGVADDPAEVLDGPLQRGVEGERGAVVAGGQGHLVAQVEAQPEAALQLQVGGDAAGADAAVLVGAELQAAAAVGQVDGVDAAARRLGGLQDGHGEAGSGQVARAGEAVVAGTDHDHIGGGLIHRGTPLGFPGPLRFTWGRSWRRRRPGRGGPAAGAGTRPG